MRTWAGGMVVSVPVLVLASCAAAEQRDDAVVLVNRADRPWLAVMMDADEATRYDPDPRFEVRDDDDRVIAPGASYVHEQSGRRRRSSRRDLSIFQYEVIVGEASSGTSIPLRTTSSCTTTFGSRFPLACRIRACSGFVHSVYSWLRTRRRPPRGLARTADASCDLRAIDAAPTFLPAVSSYH